MAISLGSAKNIAMLKPGEEPIFDIEAELYLPSMPSIAIPIQVGRSDTTHFFLMRSDKARPHPPHCLSVWLAGPLDRSIPTGHHPGRVEAPPHHHPSSSATTTCRPPRQEAAAAAAAAVSVGHLGLGGPHPAGRHTVRHRQGPRVPTPPTTSPHPPHPSSCACLLPAACWLVVVSQVTSIQLLNVTAGVEDPGGDLSSLTLHADLLAQTLLSFPDTFEVTTIHSLTT